MHHADIIASLVKVGQQPSKIARKLGVTSNAVSQVIHNKMASRRIATEISRATGKSLEELWPGRYTANTKRGRPYAA